MPDLFQTGDRINPDLGDKLSANYDLAGNLEMGRRAQRRALVKPLQPGIPGAGLGRRKGRKARSR